MYQQVQQRWMVFQYIQGSTKVASMNKWQPELLKITLDVDVWRKIIPLDNTAGQPNLAQIWKTILVYPFWVKLQLSIFAMNHIWLAFFFLPNFWKFKIWFTIRRIFLLLLLSYWKTVRSLSRLWFNQFKTWWWLAKN